MSGFVKKYKNVIVLSICILLHTVFLYGICDFRKSIETYGDELVYYSIARSLFYGKGLKVHGVSFQFQNLAYSYFLVPFFYISNSVSRIHVITLANAFLMSLSIIPVWFICKELKLKKKYTWFVVILVMVWPDMFTAGTMMSENLYWVLSLTAMYYCIKAILSCKKSYSCIAAIFCYLAYFCKEVAICFALAYVVSSILTPCSEGMLDFYSLQNSSANVLERIKISYKKFFENKIWVNLFVFIITYIFMLFIFKKILFKEVGSFYTGIIDFSFVSDRYSTLYILYGFLYYVLASILAFMIYPVLYPIVHYRKIGQEARKVYVYLLLLLTGTIMVIVLTITVREDLGRIIPRIHLRYIAPMIGLFLPAFFKSISDVEADSKYIKKNKKIIMIACVLFWIVSTLFYKGILGGCVNENAGLALSQYITTHIENLSIIENETVIFHSVSIITSLGLAILFIIWNWFEHFKRRYFPLILFLTFVFLSIANFSVGTLNLYQSYEIDDQKVCEMNLINSYFQNQDLENKNIMYICEHWGTKNAKIYDTYLDGVNTFEMSYESLIDKISEKGKDHILIPEVDFEEAVWAIPYHINTIDYFISNTGSFHLDSVIGNLEIIPEISGENFTVYINKNPYQISLPTEKFIEINFEAENYNAPLFVKSGVSHCEGEYSWTDGEKMQVKTFVSNTVDALDVHFYLSEIFNGQQEVIVYQGKNLVWDEIVTDAKEFQFTLSPIDGDCSFNVFFPNAVSPNELGLSQDERKLAFALKKIVLKK